MATKASFNWIDPLLLDQQLTEEEHMVRDSAEKFAADSLHRRPLLALLSGQSQLATFDVRDRPQDRGVKPI